MYDQELVGLIQIEDIKKNNDYAMWLNVSIHADCWLLKENLGKYRKRQGSISRQRITKMISWHFKLWYQVEKKDIVKTIWYTFGNLFYGTLKKRIYVSRTKLYG